MSDRCRTLVVSFFIIGLVIGGFAAVELMVALEC